jgi:DNA-binding CsgD family transcriptional regulator
MRENLQRAVQLSTDQGRVSARCRTLALLAIEAARLGAEQADDDLLSTAQQAADEVKKLSPLLPGRNPWSAQAEAALARVFRARGDDETALEHGRAALEAVRESEREDVMFDVVLPAAEAVLAAGEPDEIESLRHSLRRELALLTSRFTDEEVRARWFTSPTGRELKRLAAIEELPVRPEKGTEAMGLSSGDSKLLELLSQGRTNQEIAVELGASPEELSRSMAALFARIGATSRAEATSAALLGRLI